MALSRPSVKQRIVLAARRFALPAVLLDLAAAPSAPLATPLVEAAAPVVESFSSTERNMSRTPERCWINACRTSSLSAVARLPIAERAFDWVRLETMTASVVPARETREFTRDVAWAMADWRGEQTARFQKMAETVSRFFLFSEATFREERAAPAREMRVGMRWGWWKSDILAGSADRKVRSLSRLSNREYVSEENRDNAPTGVVGEDDEGKFSLPAVCGSCNNDTIVDSKRPLPHWTSTGFND
mmetsp:Transcript_34872/g.42640  ORF Transcript_34872/g.42640 Transcript_34872/m.42640 type:complete len:244 (-) Transcript_34872:790-1521(-)